MRTRESGSVELELLAEGRTAEVFAWSEGRVLKLDRPDWNGLSTFEATVLAIIAEAGLPVARPYETVTIEERTGIVLERVDGPILAEVIAAADDVAPLASQFVDLQRSLNGQVLTGLPDLVVGLPDGIRASGLPPALVEELLAVLADLDDGRRMLCHFDLHPGNVIVGSDRWVVIDWITASLGPPDADFARTLVLDPPHARTARGRFMTIVERDGMKARDLARPRLDAWIRVVAAARLAEGFEGEHAEYLSSLAVGRGR
jgi:hypothetical protein